MDAALNILLEQARPGPATERLKAHGLPTRRQEAWKFTSLRPLEAFLRAETPAESHAKKPKWPRPLLPNAVQIRIMNGAVQKGFEDVNGISVNISDSPSAPRADSAVSDMVAALARGALTIAIAPHALLDRPLEIVILSDGGAGRAHHVSIAIEAGENSQALVIERHLGAGAYLNAGALGVRLGRNARLSHVKMQEDAPESFHLADLAATLGRDAVYRRFVLSLGARLARDEAHVVCAGPGADLRLNGAFLGGAEQHLDHTTVIDHAVPQTGSYQVYKGVLDGDASGVFQGRILVRPDAQKTDGHQMTKALLLSPGAEMNAKPELEIHADDVKCSHGATAGEIESEQLFYMQARGVPEAEARALLVQAFLDEVFDEVPDAALREVLIGRLHERLARTGPGVETGTEAGAGNG